MLNAVYEDGSDVLVTESDRVYYNKTGGIPCYFVPIRRGSWNDKVRNNVTIHFRSHLPIHDACWTMLRSFLATDQVPVEELCDFFRSGLIRGDSPRPPKTNRYKPLSALSFLVTEQKPPQPSVSVARRRQTMLFKTHDPFARLSLELCQIILRHMSSDSFYNFRLASRSMGELFFSSIFWETRFEHGNDCGFVDVKREIHAHRMGRDQLRAVYRYLRGSRVSLVWKWKQVAWSRCRTFTKMHNLHYQFQKCAANRSKRIGIQEDDWLWNEARASPAGTGYRACPITQSIRIPNNPFAVTISVIQTSSFVSVTGIRIRSVDEVVSVGCLLPDSATTLINGAFTGFETTMKDGRISGLKVVADDTTSRWVGDVHGVYYTERLSLGTCVIALQAEFDVSLLDSSHTHLLMLSIQRCGILSLNVAHKASDMEMAYSGKSLPDPVLQNALWFHKIDPQGLFFNGRSYISVVPRVGDLPHRWVLFGGRDGSLLSSLTGLRVTMINKHRGLSKIVFFYRHTSRSHQVKPPFGAVAMDLTLGPLRCMLDDLDGTSYEFDIDGPGGERINKVEVRVTQDRYLEPGKIVYKVSEFHRMNARELVN